MRSSPARYASERFPGKPLAPIAGVPMVVRVLQNMQQARSLADVFVATDDERIATAVHDAGGRAVMTARRAPLGERPRVGGARGHRRRHRRQRAGRRAPPPGLGRRRARRARSPTSGSTSPPPSVAVPRLTAASPDVVTVARDEHGTAHYFSRADHPARRRPGLAPRRRLRLPAGRARALRHGAAEPARAGGEAGTAARPRPRPAHRRGRGRRRAARGRPPRRRRRRRARAGGAGRGHRRRGRPAPRPRRRRRAHRRAHLVRRRRRAADELRREGRPRARRPAAPPGSRSPC